MRVALRLLLSAGMMPSSQVRSATLQQLGPATATASTSPAEIGEWTIPLKNATMETQMKATAAITFVLFKFAETMSKMSARSVTMAIQILATAAAKTVSIKYAATTSSTSTNIATTATLSLATAVTISVEEKFAETAD